MGLHLNLPDSVPGNRTTNLAISAAIHNDSGTIKAVYQRLSALMCWDAALFCAWAANGIHSAAVSHASSAFGVVTDNGLSYVSMLGKAPFTGHTVTSIGELMQLPLGAFVGFINMNDRNRLRHVMIHTGNGWGCGNKNDCVLRLGHTIGWERLDMSAFFLADAGFNGNGNTRMIYQTVTGQTI